jgi:UDP:flavonoid glycosyltransferase YjiC (YdhE family)
LFADIPELFGNLTERSRDNFIGPLTWEPPVELPEWWDKLDPNAKTIYVNMGSTGEVGLLNSIFKSLEQLPVQVIAATSARGKLDQIPKNVFIAEYLPGSICAKRADLVIYNGVSGGGYQALLQGTPILGIPTHFDSGMFMQVILKNNCGLSITPRQIQQGGLNKAILSLIEDQGIQESVQKIKRLGKSLDFSHSFSEILTHLYACAGRQNLTIGPP